MKPLSAEEVEVIGQWKWSNKIMVADEACKRIEWLVSSSLVLVGTEESGWQSLYQDPSDGRFWLLSYPQSNQHGGGPPSLKVVEAHEAAKFNVTQCT